MEDRDIVALYWKRDQQAITSTQEKYGAYCYAIAHNILASHPDSEECVNDTYLAAWNAMPPSKPGILKPFLAKLTRGSPSTATSTAPLKSAAAARRRWCWRSSESAPPRTEIPRARPSPRSWAWPSGSLSGRCRSGRGISLCGGTFSPNPCPRRPGAAASAKTTHPRSCPARERSSKHT